MLLESLSANDGAGWNWNRQWQWLETVSGCLFNTGSRNCINMEYYFNNTWGLGATYMCQWDTYMCQWIGHSWQWLVIFLVPYHYLKQWGFIANWPIYIYSYICEIWSKYTKVFQSKNIWKFPQNPSYFVQAFNISSYVDKLDRSIMLQKPF